MFKYLYISLFILTWSTNGLTQQNSDIDANKMKLLPEIALSKEDVQMFTKMPKTADELHNLYDLSFLEEKQPEFIKKAKKLRKGVAKDNVERIYIFASRGQPHSELKDLFLEAKGHDNVVIVFRGIYDNENFIQGSTEIYKYLEGIHKEDIPTVEIDPVKFEKHSVYDVPTMMIMKNNQVLSRVKGLYSPKWLIDQYTDNNRSGDLGVYGDVVQVAEPSIMERLKTELSQIDFDKKKKDGINNFWKKYDYTNLPNTKENITRKLDPSFVITADIRTQEGVAIAQAGERVNPLKVRRFESKLFIFNPTDKKQLNVIKNKVAGLPANTRYQLIATRLNSEETWEHLEDVESFFGRAVFMLDDFVKQRFSLRSVPSMVEADNTYFYVHEFTSDIPKNKSKAAR